MRILRFSKQIVSAGPSQELRFRTLSIYRKILRTGKHWEGPEEEKTYIQNEASSLFRKHSVISDPIEIEQKVFEAETRLALGLHYKIPYPRPYNVAPDTVMKDGRVRQIQPAYLHSYIEKD
eukprot:TRINITY_DN6251_c0_g1::TRINITY_DN6251_c0_g1_i1::g.119::m.119 TRINITY_DN6251_c0_g1::TRINITY_DN6251_c0_g1_i1::g.119  ORF type:complete len:121 (+),score=8.23,sp/B5FYC7/LYRM1_TAEGU/40.00/7e-19,Complex1_LYR/PF05347.10/7.1e-11,Complex1_LYR_1/PF13232.1/1.9e-07 TRINITY_DN6251_c0_g1_i1:99-461(+)